MRYFEKTATTKLVKFLFSHKNPERVMKNLRARGYYPGSRLIREIGGGGEGRAALFTSNVSRDGLAVHKVFDHKSAIVSPETIKEKERIFKKMKGDINFARFYGTPYNNDEIHITEYLKPNRNSNMRRINKRLDSDELYNRLGTELDDVHSNNVINNKILDFVPANMSTTTPLGKAVMEEAPKIGIHDNSDIATLSRLGIHTHKLTRGARHKIQKSGADLSRMVDENFRKKGFKFDAETRPLNTLMKESYNRKKEPILLGPYKI